MFSSDLNHFLRLWTYFTDPDPTGGQVNYLSRVEAQETGLAYVQGDNKTVLRVDSSTNLPLGVPRNSCVVPFINRLGGRPDESDAIINFLS